MLLWELLGFMCGTSVTSHIHVSFIAVATSFYIYCKDETLSVCVCVGELNSADHKVFFYF